MLECAFDADAKTGDNIILNTRVLMDTKSEVEQDPYFGRAFSIRAQSLTRVASRAASPTVEQPVVEPSLPAVILDFNVNRDDPGAADHERRVFSWEDGGSATLHVFIRVKPPDGSQKMDLTFATHLLLVRGDPQYHHLLDAKLRVRYQQHPDDGRTTWLAVFDEKPETVDCSTIGQPSLVQHGDTIDIFLIFKWQVRNGFLPPVFILTRSTCLSRTVGAFKPRPCQSKRQIRLCLNGTSIFVTKTLWAFTRCNPTVCVFALHPRLTSRPSHRTIVTPSLQFF
jgi:hypothetical protein